jgi:hypothetical protein
MLPVSILIPVHPRRLILLPGQQIISLRIPVLHPVFRFISRYSGSSAGIPVRQPVFRFANRYSGSPAGIPVRQPVFRFAIRYSGSPTGIPVRQPVFRPAKSNRIFLTHAKKVCFSGIPTVQSSCILYWRKQVVRFQETNGKDDSDKKYLHDPLKMVADGNLKVKFPQE